MKKCFDIWKMSPYAILYVSRRLSAVMLFSRVSHQPSSIPTNALVDLVKMKIVSPIPRRKIQTAKSICNTVIFVKPVIELS